jgi:hypothetical protein
MMVTTTPATTAAENIALLHFLHAVPAPRSKNPTDHLPLYKNGYTLPVETERRLTSTLAFLSSVNDDPNRIPAICVEEIPEKGSLNVLLAVNKAGPGGGIPVLESTKRDFETIFERLAQSPECRAYTRLYCIAFTDHSKVGRTQYFMQSSPCAGLAFSVDSD